MTLTRAQATYFYAVCKDILHELLSMKGAFHFFKPTRPDGRIPAEQTFPSMSFFQVQEKLDNEEYAIPDDFVADVRLIFLYARFSNQEGSRAHGFASDLSAQFEILAGRLPHVMSPAERDGGLVRLLELKKYRYLLKKEGHQ
jgi:hypothetical protein